jgi:hypothetical protein
MKPEGRRQNAEGKSAATSRLFFFLLHPPDICLCDRVVDLQEEARVHDRLVLLAHHLGDRARNC